MTEEEQIERVTAWPSDIKLIKNPSEFVQLTAVKQNGYAIDYIENPSEDVKLAAVKQDGFSIQFIEDPSEAVQLASVKEDPRSIKFIKNSYESVQLIAINGDVQALEYIKNPSLELLNICKVKIIRYILENIRDGEIRSANDILLQKIKYTGWIEINIIKRSLLAMPPELYN